MNEQEKFMAYIFVNFNNAHTHIYIYIYSNILNMFQQFIAFALIINKYLNF